MKNLIDEILELDGTPGMSKHEQLVMGISNAIRERIIEMGDLLPSVNQLIKETGFARETIMKAYRELKERGIVVSKKRLGFYVASTDLGKQFKVALLMFANDTFQTIFYQNFRNELGDKAEVEVFFHHNNIEVFEKILAHIRGRYAMYVVSPTPHPKTVKLLLTLPMNKFLMVDRYVPLPVEFNHITQEFEESSYRVFSELSPAIKQFDEMYFFHKPASIIPVEIMRAFKKFLIDFNIKGGVRHEYVPGSIERGKVYFTLDNAELWQMVKDCKAKNLQPGKDVGLLSKNDELVKEIVLDGITTYSSDFGLMARNAAQFVLNREPIQETVPMNLMRRNTL